MIKLPPWGYDQIAAVETIAIILANDHKSEHWPRMVANRRNQFRLEAHSIIEEAMNFWEEHNNKKETSGPVATRR